MIDKTEKNIYMMEKNIDKIEKKNCLSGKDVCRKERIIDLKKKSNNEGRKAVGKNGRTDGFREMLRDGRYAPAGF